MKGSDKFFELPKEEGIKLISELYNALNCSKNRKEIRLILRDILSPQEMYAIVKRIQVSILLIHGYSVEKIREILNVSTDKITNVRRSLNRHGEGYELIEKRLMKQLRKQRAKAVYQEKKRTAVRGSFAHLRKTYPAHFLLFNLLDYLDEIEKQKRAKPGDLL